METTGLLSNITIFLPVIRHAYVPFWPCTRLLSKAGCAAISEVIWVVTTEYIFYCKRAILFLSSSKILTPHPPLRPRRWTWTGDFKCREVKTGFCRNISMQTGSSGTLIGWKSGQTTFVPLWDQCCQIPPSLHGRFCQKPRPVWTLSLPAKSFFTADFTADFMATLRLHFYLFHEKNHISNPLTHTHMHQYNKPPSRDMFQTSLLYSEQCQKYITTQ